MTKFFYLKIFAEKSYDIQFKKKSGVIFGGNERQLDLGSNVWNVKMLVVEPDSAK